MSDKDEIIALLKEKIANLAATQVAKKSRKVIVAKIEAAGSNHSFFKTDITGG